MSTNLLDETVEFLEKYGKTLDDVLYIQGDKWCVNVTLKDLADPFYFTHIYNSPFFEEIGSIYNFYNALEKLSA